MTETQGQLLDKLDDKVCSKGFAVVPVKPDGKMVEAGAKAIHDADDMADTVWPDGDGDEGYRGGRGYVRICQNPDAHREAAVACHLAMLDVAPKP